MSKKVLVTGGSGFIGSALVRGLLREGWHVRCLDDNSRGNPRRLEGIMDDIEFIPGDVRDAEVVDQAMRGMDACAHLAYVNGTEFFYKKPQLVLEVGIKGALWTLESAIRHSVPQYWYMSSSEVYQTPPMIPTDETAPFMIPDPLNPRYSYGGGKAASELMAINYGRGVFEKTVIVRPHNVYGPDMGWEHVIPQFALRAKQAIAANPTGAVPFPIQGDGSAQRSFCHIDDFTEGCLLAYLKGADQNIYHIGTQFEHTIREVAEMTVRELGREAEIIPGPEPAGATQRRVPNTAKIEALGYRASIPLAQGLHDTVSWYVANDHLMPAKSE